MKRIVYQIFVYVFLAMFLVTSAMFIYELASSSTFNVWAILCLVLSLTALVGFVLNQVFYRQFGEKDETRYEKKECPHCHTKNDKDAPFCKNCGKDI